MEKYRKKIIQLKIVLDVKNRLIVCTSNLENLK